MFYIVQEFFKKRRDMVPASIRDSTASMLKLFSSKIYTSFLK